jgi:hypothetical protein
MPTYELLREGEWTTDGRMLTPDTITWKDPIPLLRRADEIGQDGSEIVGKVTSIRRVGNKILGDPDIELDEDQLLTCDVDHLGQMFEHLGGGMEITGARLVAAHVNAKDQYPWKDNE